MGFAKNFFIGFLEEANGGCFARVPAFFEAGAEDVGLIEENFSINCPAREKLE